MGFNNVHPEGRMAAHLCFLTSSRKKDADWDEIDVDDERGNRI
jgi:hypothetical protein